MAPTNSSDIYPGTITQPWATWKKGFESARSGDTVYIRGGVYKPADVPLGNYIQISKIVGTKANPVCIFAYPGDYESGNIPILDCSLQEPGPTGDNTILSFGWSHHWRFFGLTIRNVYQNELGKPSNGFYGFGTSNFHWENCTMHHIMGRGWIHNSIGDYEGWTEPDSTYFINCDAYNLCDSLSLNGAGLPNGGNNADGIFLILVAANGGYGLIQGCRAWACSDDGLTCDGDGYIEIKNSWSFNNGYPDIEYSEGNAMKYGSFGTSEDSDSLRYRKITNCITANNMHIAYDPNNGLSHSWPRAEIINCVSYNDYVSAVVQNQTTEIEVNEELMIFQNNVFYKPTYTPFINGPWLSGNKTYRYIATSNNWQHEEVAALPWYFVEDNPNYKVTDADFLSLDWTELMRPRKADGSLPDIEFMKLAPGSDLIDRGTYVGLPYLGSAPDLGYSEYTDGTSTPFNKPPEISILTPTKSVTFTAPANITIEASAYDPDGSISKVEFFIGPVKLGEKLAAPYQYIWKDVGVGTYAITAVATDNGNSKTTSPAISVVVEKSASSTNQLPIVSIVKPDKSVKYKKHDNISVEVKASDTDGNIVQVELKNGDNTLVIMQTPPYIYTLTDADTGSYKLIATATDNMGGISISPVLELIVDPDDYKNPDLISLYPNPNNGLFSINHPTLSSGEIVMVRITSNNGKVVYSEKIQSTGQLFEVDLTNQVPGLYVLIIAAGNKTIASCKFLKL